MTEIREAWEQVNSAGGDLSSIGQALVIANEFGLPVDAETVLEAVTHVLGHLQDAYFALSAELGVDPLTGNALDTDAGLAELLGDYDEPEPIVYDYDGTDYWGSDDPYDDPYYR